jgi:hypothetical protein
VTRCEVSGGALDVLCRCRPCAAWADRLTGEAADRVAARPARRSAVADRDRWVRLFMRLERAVSRWEESKGWLDDVDDELAAAWRRVLRDAAGSS